MLKGNPNFQGILNWILQISYKYHCSKQQKNIENLLFIEHNIVIFFCPTLFMAICASFAFLTADAFQFLDAALSKILNVTSDSSYCCIKNRVYCVYLQVTLFHIFN